MLVDDPVTYAKRCTTKREAAKAACAIESEISYGKDHDEFWYDSAENALARLRINHPGFWELDAYQAPPGLSRGFREAERADDEPIPALDVSGVPHAESDRTADVHTMPRAHKRFRAASCLACVLAGLVLIASQIPAPSSQAIAQTPPTLHLGPWKAFLAACEAGPSPGQGNTAEACGCWRSNLQKVAVSPDYALDVLNNAEISGGQAYMVPENIGNVAINQAMNGCGLYTQQS